MIDLERQLSEAAKKKELNPKRRAFIIAEGIYYNTGEMCPLKQLVKLARQYKLRVMLDESLTIGVRIYNHVSKLALIAIIIKAY